MKFADKAIVYTGSQVIGSILQIAMGMFMVRYLSKYEYGTFRQIMLLSVLASSTIAIGIPQSLPYFIPRASTPSARKQLALQVFGVLAVLGLLGATVLYVFRFQIGGAFHNARLAEMAGIWCLYFLFLMPSKCAEETLIAVGAITSASILNMATILTEFVVVVGTLVLTGRLMFVLVAMLGLYGLRLLVEIAILLSLDGGRPKLMDWPSLKKQVTYSLPLGVSVLTGMFRSYTDKLLVSLLYSPETFAIFARGAFELPLVKILPYTLGGLIIPKISAHHKAGNISKIVFLWQEKARTVALVFFPLFVFSFVFAEKIITVLFTPEYADSTLIFRIYLCLLPFRIVQYRAILQGIGHTKPIMSATWVSLGATVLLSVAFQRVFGISGPALAMVMGELVGAGFMLWRSKVALGVTWPDLIPVSKLATPLCGAVLLGVLVAPLTGMDHSKLVVLGMAGTIYFGLYVVAMKLLHVVTQEDWELICRWASLRVLRGSKL
jgi:O-antigen/teichoic acid export membrane protein